MITITPRKTNKGALNRKNHNNSDDQQELILGRNTPTREEQHGENNKSQGQRQNKKNKKKQEPNYSNMQCQWNKWENQQPKLNYQKQGKSEGFDSWDRPINLTQIGLKWSICRPCDLEIWWMTPKNNKACLLYYIKLCVSFQIHQWIQTGATIRKRPIWVKLDDFS